MVWQHRPKDLPDEKIGPWYDNQVRMRSADQAFVGSVKWTAPTAQYTTEELCSIPKVEVPFAGIDSTTLVGATKVDLPTTIVASRIVSPKMVEHLLRDRVDIAIGKKSAPVSGDGRVPEWPITNMESIAALYFTEFGAGEARASIFHKSDIVEYPEGRVQKVLVARNLHPDTERVSQMCREGDIPVFLMLAALGDKAVVGEASEVSVPSAEERARWTEKDRQAYDERLLKNYVFHLYPGGRRPAKSEIRDENILTLNSAKTLMEDLITDSGKSSDDILTAAKDKYVQVDGQLVSLYVYLVTAIHQTRNNHAVAEACGPYTQTLMPPQIFALKEGDSTFHSRLQCLAYKCIGPENFLNLAVIAPNTYGDEGLKSLYEKVFGKEKTTPMKPLFDGRRGDGIPAGVIGTLVLEANSDSLGDNLPNEGGCGSQEGAIGVFVRTGCCRSNPNATMGVAYT